MSIAASGPLYRPGMDAYLSDMRPKALAQLRYTAADISYLSRHWRRESYDTAPFEHHVSKYNADFNAVTAGFEEAQEFLAAGAADEGFDGGALVFSFSGHGREGDGTLFLDQDTYFSPDDFVDICLSIRRSVPAAGSLRLAMLLDSCYSGAFLLRVLERVLHQHSDDLAPEYLLASSMPDEVSWELAPLQHGLSTFCFSVTPEHLGAMTATADYIGPTWAIAEGAEGCSLVTGGPQNPITYSSHSLEGAFGSVDIWQGEPFQSQLRSRDEWRADLMASRDRLHDALSVLRKTRSMSGRLTDSFIAGEVARMKELRTGLRFDLEPDT